VVRLIAHRFAQASMPMRMEKPAALPAGFSLRG
jgi:hypothetical protein